MSENEKPALGSTEAAVLTVVELIARAASMSEQHMSYWLDLYYQVRSRHEFEHALTLDDMVVKTEGPDPVMARLDELEKKIDELKNGVTLKMDVHPAPYKTAEGPRVWPNCWPKDLAQDPSSPAPSEETAGPQRAPAPTEKAEEDQTPVMRGRETIKLQERAKSESRSEAVKRQKAEERAFKMRVADRLRDARANGVKIGDIVTASCGAVPDGAVMTILEGRFRPIADYRALDAALDQLAVEK